MEQFEYDVPPFYDFANAFKEENKDVVEAYFESEHEGHCGITAQTEEVIYSDGYHSEDLEVATEDPLQVSVTQVSGYHSYSTSDLGLDSSSKAFIRRSRSVQSLVEKPKTFVSLAEAIHQFHKKTPDRFHTKSSKEKIVINKGSTNMLPTIPTSPHLATKLRARPTTVLSHQDRELKEFQDLQKLKIKALPVNPKVLSGPIKAHCAVKKPTIIEPFNLTKIQVKRPPTPVKSTPKFHAQPVPKCIRENLEPSFKPVMKLPLTICHTPKVLQRYQRLKPEKVTVEIKKKPILKPTMIEPFSFLKRDEDSQQKKQQALLEIVEQEKKNREFRAKPLPKIYSAEKSKHSFFSSSSSLKSSNETINVQPVFKAKPAKVLTMNPFIPKKEERFIETAEFQLSLENRGIDRKIFDQKLKEKQALCDENRKAKKDYNLRLEQEEVLKLRKQAEHKANCIRKYKEIKEIASKPVTIPVSPKFHINKLHNKENSVP